MSKKILFLFTLITFIISHFCFATRKTRHKTDKVTTTVVSEEGAEPSEVQASKKAKPTSSRKRARRAPKRPHTIGKDVPALLESLNGDSDRRDFSGADLEGLDLSVLDNAQTETEHEDLRLVVEEYDFTGADFTDARCRGVIFKNCIFDSAYMYNANFSESEFTECRFISAELPYAIFIETIITSCKFASAWIAGANFTRATITDTTFRGCSCKTSQSMLESKERCPFTKFTEAHLKDVSFYHAEIENAKFMGAVINGKSHFGYASLNLYRSQLGAASIGNNVEFDCEIEISRKYLDGDSWGEWVGNVKDWLLHATGLSKA
jgi:uncharacterized protein YjbI with pentapeptide repeats